ncbi:MULTISPECIES: MerR family transcriptional regulator [Microbacterium]|uniref:MerR family transcriptional regulator n=1 Tax=Microbacterium TaxID=33882 RepID=UPI0027835AC7|nr:MULTISPECIES: MerR family transcriptional regulator [Microbacterium]MDQ1084606.1 DNA-binding transcriptional MerR regulator [Microbacterium sp. SORGH_AS_0344]MDQ1170117.1 DNA-binding transcriptional MerR regulator [Microbacterium proteolyticum]
MAETSQLMTIGRFSSLTRLSVRMLRHYDTHGVLVPADIDPWTGYRRYAPHQLADAAAVRDLRDVGFGVSAIGALLAARGTPAWTRALHLQRAELQEEVRVAEARVSLIARLLDHGDPTMSITLTRTTVPALTAVALRGTVGSYADEGQLWGRLMPLLAERSITPIGPCGVIEHDDQFVEHDVDLSIFLPVVAGTTVNAPLEIIDLPARDCLIARVLGPYDQISRAHDLINARLVEDGLNPRSDGTLAAHAFNVYLTTPDRVSAADLVTDVCLPLA